MGKHKQVACKKCCRVMRSDHLERHMKQHENGKFEAESLSGSSFSASTTSLESNFSPVSTTRYCKPILINEEAVLKTMDMHAEEYEGKLKLGEIVYKHVKDHGIPEESLPKEYKEAKDLYIKQQEYKQKIEPEHERKVKCPHCSLSLSSRGSIYNHIKVKHSHEQGWMCAHCDYRSMHKWVVKRHMINECQLKLYKAWRIMITD
jgi:hypothetical protein